MSRRVTKAGHGRSNFSARSRSEALLSARVGITPGTRTWLNSAPSACALGSMRRPSTTRRRPA